MGDAAAWFDDEDSLDEFKIAATRFGVSLNAEALSDARLAIQDMLDEQQERALDQLDRDDWDEEDRDREPKAKDDTAEIDAMFGMFGN
jgi:hypothetical protein